MPAISIDTFLACSLMVMLALAAMAGTSKALYPYVHRIVDGSVAERYGEFSRYLLLNDGNPSDWGRDASRVPEGFGLANAGSLVPYELDIDKVSRLDNLNRYSLTYFQVFTALRMADISFRIEIKPIFEVGIMPTETFPLANTTIYEFEVVTEKRGLPVQADLRAYVIAESYVEACSLTNSLGKTRINVTIPNSVNGPALLTVFARSVYDHKVVSFNAHAFSHNLLGPQTQGSLLMLSPLNNTLNISLGPEVMLSDVYALTINYNTSLTQGTAYNESATFSLPCFVDSSPTLIVATGWNASSFFAEWTAYPQLPVMMGADFADASTLSSALTFSYVVLIDSVFYECIVWVGGPRE